MIEMVYSSKETEELSEVRVPKNIRQIGDNKSNRKIYMEDYVMTSLKKEPDNQDGVKYGVLLGEIQRAKGNTYVFVKGLVETREVIEHSVIFNDDIWATLYKDIKKYFEGLDIVGWFVSVPYTVKNDMTSIQKIHLDNFAGNDKVCYLNDRTEHEDGFFAFESGSMKKQEGYYIFYEKNEKMKKYLKQTQGNRSVLVSTDENVQKENVHKESVQKENVEQEIKSKGYEKQEIKEAEYLTNSASKETRNNLKNSVVDANPGISRKEKNRENSITKKSQKSIELRDDDKVQMTFRDVIKKQVDEEQSKGFKMGNFAYGISSVLIIALLLSTVVMLNNYGELRSLKASIESMSGADSVEAVNEILSSIIPTTESNGQSESQEMIETEIGAVEDADEEMQQIVEGQQTGENQSAIEGTPQDVSEADDVVQNFSDITENAGANSEENTSLGEVSGQESNEEYNDETEYEPDVQIEANSDSSDEEVNGKSFNGIYHTVTEGQTLYDISIIYYGDSSMVERIKEINSIDDDYMIQEGQRLLLP